MLGCSHPRGYKAEAVETFSRSLCVRITDQIPFPPPLSSASSGCTGLLTAGYKITWDKGEEGEEDEDEGSEVNDTPPPHTHTHVLVYTRPLGPGNIPFSIIFRLFCDSFPFYILGGMRFVSFVFGGGRGAESARPATGGYLPRDGAAVPRIRQRSGRGLQASK